MKLFVLLSSTENRYLVLSRCSYIVLDEVSSFNLDVNLFFFCFFCEILNQTKYKLIYKGKFDRKPYSVLNHSSSENLSKCLWYYCRLIV